MRLVWVQQWSYLPVVVEDIDMSCGRQSRERLPSTQLPVDNRLHSTDRGDSRPTSKPRGIVPANPIPSYGMNSQPTLAAGYPTDLSGHQPMTYAQAQANVGGGFDLSTLSDTLPHQFNHQDEIERSTSGSGTTLHQQAPSPFAGQAPMTTPGYNIYANQYGTPYQQLTGNAQAYPHPQGNQTPHAQGPYPSHTYYPTHHQQQQQPYMLYPGAYGQAGQHHPGLPTPYAQSFGRGTNQGFGVGPMSQPGPDVASISGRVPQYGGFSPTSHLGYGLGSGAQMGRSGPIAGRFPCIKISQTVSKRADSDPAME
ncbi:MAG: hypothetical protein Q9168_000279 [Polycauliona sp. 1 TL-2023]